MGGGRHFDGSQSAACVHGVGFLLSDRASDKTVLSEGAQQFLKDVAAKEGKTESEVEKDFFTKVRTSSLIQRFASVEEVANTIVYLASPLSSATNGSVIKIDGGSTGGIL